MTDFVANFNLEKNEIEAEFELEQPVQFDALLEINASPTKVSELINDLEYQTKDEVDDAIQAEADIINARIDEEVETLNTEINKKVETVTGSDLIKETYFCILKERLQTIIAEQFPKQAKDAFVSTDPRLYIPVKLQSELLVL